MKFLHQICTVVNLTPHFPNLIHSSREICFARQFVNTLVVTEKRTLHQYHSKVGEKTSFKIVKKQGGCFRSVLSQTTLNNLLHDCKSVQEQIEVFHSYVSLTEDDYSARNLICKNIEEVFKSVFPDSSVCLIGSSVTGIGLRGCDVDLSLQLSNQNIHQDCASQNTVISNVDVASGKVPKSDFFLLANKQQLIFLQKILRESGVVEKAAVIPGRYPILNFTCNNLGCDLSINNRKGILTTNLIQLCSKSDSRVAPLYQLIKYWMRHLKLTGGPLRLKSYAVFLMVVYFLQTRHPIILPPLQEFLEHMDSECYNATQCSGKIPHSSSTENLGDLLREFFFFYGNFDFSSVICPLKNELIDGKSMMLKYPEFELNTVSIQDPMNVDVNVTTGVDWKHCKSLIKSLLSECDAFHENLQQTSTEQNWDLLVLLNHTSIDSSFTAKDAIGVKVPLTFTDNSDDVRIEYLNHAIDKVFRIFETCLLFRCEACNSDPDSLKGIKTPPGMIDLHIEKFKEKNGENESAKNERTFDDSEKVLVSRSIRVTSSDTWLGRSNYCTQYFARNEDEFLESEKEISKKILQNRTRDERSKFIFLCECSGVLINCKIYLKVTLKPLNRNVFVPKLGIFLKEYLYKYAIKYNILL